MHASARQHMQLRTEKHTCICASAFAIVNGDESASAHVVEIGPFRRGQASKVQDALYFTSSIVLFLFCPDLSKVGFAILNFARSCIRLSMRCVCSVFCVLQEWCAKIW